MSASTIPVSTIPASPYLGVPLQMSSPNQDPSNQPSPPVPQQTSTAAPPQPFQPGAIPSYTQWHPSVTSYVSQQQQHPFAPHQPLPSYVLNELWAAQSAADPNKRLEELLQKELQLQQEQFLYLRLQQIQDWQGLHGKTQDVLFERNGWVKLLMSNRYKFKFLSARYIYNHIRHRPADSNALLAQMREFTKRHPELNFRQIPNPGTARSLLFGYVGP
jgi:hypothetical protein